MQFRLLSVSGGRFVTVLNMLIENKLQPKFRVNLNEYYITLMFDKNTIFLIEYLK